MKPIRVVAVVAVCLRYQSKPHGNTVATHAVWQRYGANRQSILQGHGAKMMKKFKGKKTKADKKNWTSVEEVALTKAWVHVSTCRKVGNEQNIESVWGRILEHFKDNVKDTTRTHHSLNTKWQNMNTAMGVFNGLFIQQLRKCLVDEAEYVPLADIVVDEKLGYVEEPVEIVDTMVKKLKNREVLLFKVKWKHRKGSEYTWEPEEELIKYYPAFHQEWFVRTQTE
ncbi:reverse transcriptase domain-containing protein [Artemisia annua]|uniref:Reverse transcriptase domain-containing protein n=1 Tax=Artemisia annua TaxID=35608 RepID=A0A2U1L8H3_ARTAN|nr:reverse transcriptase domain-containing protein [Artemisia annua]